MVTKEIVEANKPLALTLAMIRPWKKRIDTVENTRRLYLEYLAQALVNRRLENRARSGGSSSWMAARRKSPGAPTWALSTEMTILPKPQAIDSRVTKLGRANLARARRLGRGWFN